MEKSWKIQYTHISVGPSTTLKDKTWFVRIKPCPFPEELHYRGVIFDKLSCFPVGVDIAVEKSESKESKVGSFNLAYMSRIYLVRQ